MFPNTEEQLKSLIISMDPYEVFIHLKASINATRSLEELCAKIELFSKMTNDLRSMSQ